MQRTLAKAVSVSGVGLHTGCQVTLTMTPAPPDTGIVFRRTDLQNFAIEARRQWVSRVMLATTLMKKGVMLSTVEHLLSALYGLKVDNLFVDVDSLEIPILDGSARPFVQMVRAAGLVDQDVQRKYLVVDSPIRIEDGDKYVVVEPSDSLEIHYQIDFTHPAIGKQELHHQLSPEIYEHQIAYARTFGFLAEVEELRKKGLIRGGSLENAVVLDDERIVNGDLRAPDEFVRHKVLDLIGDVSLCGRPLIGKIRAYKAGHALHTNLATELARPSSKTRLITEEELAPSAV